MNAMTSLDTAGSLPGSRPTTFALVACRMLAPPRELRARRKPEAAWGACARLLQHGVQTAWRSFEERGSRSFVDEGRNAQLLARWPRDRRIEPFHLRLR